jgi:putative ABC transport system permease protein
MNLAWRDIRHNLSRFVMTGLGLGLLLGVVLSMIGIYRGLVLDALTIARAPQADIWIVEAKSHGPFAGASRIPTDTRDAVARIYGIEAAGAVTYQTVEGNVRGSNLRLYVIGFQTGHPGGPPAISQGRAIAQSHYELIADQSTGLQISERIQLGRVNFEVVGLTSQQVNSGGDPAVYMALSDAQKLQSDLDPAASRIQQARGATPSSRDTVNAIVARISPNADVTTIAASIRQWKHLDAMTQDEQEAILSQSVVDRARRQIGMFTGLLLTVSAVIIALIIYTMTIEKIRAIATLKLIGAPDTRIVSMIVQQALSLGAIGFTVGATLIFTVKDYFPRRVILETDNVISLAGIVFIVCLLSSGFGVRVALRADPATALGG